MIYTLERAFHNLMHGIRRYYLISIQLFIGSVIISCCVNYTLSSNERYQELASQISENQYRVDAYAKGMSNNTENIPITYADYIELSSMYKDDIDFHYVSCAAIMVEDEQYIVFADRWHYDIIGLDAYDQIYVGEKVATLIEENTYFPLTSFCKISSTDILIDGASRNWHRVAGTKVDKLVLDDTYEDYTLPIDQCIIVPAKLVSSAFEQSQEMFKVSLAYHMSREVDDKQSSHIKNEIIGYLGRLHPGYSFRIDGKQLPAIEKRMNYMKINIDTFLWISAFLMIIVTIGTIGNLMIAVLRRMQALSTSISMGATLKQLFVELFLEVFFVVQSSVLIGLITSVFISPQLSNTYCSVTSHGETWYVLFLVGLVITAIASCACISLLRDMNPTHIMKSY